MASGGAGTDTNPQVNILWLPYLLNGKIFSLLSSPAVDILLTPIICIQVWHTGKKTNKPRELFFYSLIDIFINLMFFIHYNVIEQQQQGSGIP